MDTDKLLKAIQLLINEELKQQLPKAVKNEVAKLLNEANVITPKQKSKGLSMAKAILGEDIVNTITPTKIKKEVHYTKNPVLNQILNETRQMSVDMGDTEFRTANFDTSNASSIIDRAAFAQKLGYGDTVNIPSTTIEGRSVNTSNENVAPVIKALNRDYSELVKRFKK